MYSFQSLRSESRSVDQTTVSVHHTRSDFLSAVRSTFVLMFAGHGRGIALPSKKGPLWSTGDRTGGTLCRRVNMPTCLRSPLATSNEQRAGSIFCKLQGDMRDSGIGLPTGKAMSIHPPRRGTERNPSTLYEATQLVFERASNWFVKLTARPRAEADCLATHPPTRESNGQFPARPGRGS